ncbi:helix-turn-helix domain-containing protein [Kangiella sp.]|uniref:helix-turn-helix domain-containing protein n=1 Tax=Kangiella sp. TaxID=1920245 RepID=UPI003A9161FA
MTHSNRKQNEQDNLLSGKRIRDLRRRKGLNLQELSDKAGISVGFLSQVERDKATPSLGTLAQLASVLGVHVEYFIARTKPTDSITRSQNRERFAVADSSLSYEQISTNLPGGTLTSLMIFVPVGYVSEIARHSGEEMLVVIEGSIKQTLGDSTFVLNSGDTLHFMGDTPHSFANPGDVPAKLVWTGTTPRLIGKEE